MSYTSNECSGQSAFLPLYLKPYKTLYTTNQPMDGPHYLLQCLYDISSESYKLFNGLMSYIIIEWSVCFFNHFYYMILCMTNPSHGLSTSLSSIPISSYKLFNDLISYVIDEQPVCFFSHFLNYYMILYMTNPPYHFLQYLHHHISSSIISHFISSMSGLSAFLATS